MLTASGIPFKEALIKATANTPGSRSATLRHMAQCLEEGKSLDEIIKQSGNQLSTLEQSIWRQGLLTGDYPQAFADLVDLIDLENSLNSTMKKTLGYPVLLLHLAAFLLPVPLLIRGNGISTYFTHVFDFLLPFYIFGLVVCILNRLKHTKNVINKPLDFLLLLLPVIGGSLKSIAIARYCRGFSRLLNVGLPVKVVIVEAGSHCGNQAVASWFSSSGLDAVQNESIMPSFSRRLPEELSAIWSNAAVVGRLVDSLESYGSNLLTQASSDLQRQFEWLAKCIYYLIVLMAFLRLV